MLITLSIIQSLNGIQIIWENNKIKFYNYQDRMWCEINNDDTDNILFEGQVTDFKELDDMTLRFDILNNWDFGRTLGLLTSQIMQTELRNKK
jgi:hypothetical protein